MSAAQDPTPVPQADVDTHPDASRNTEAEAVEGPSILDEYITLGLDFWKDSVVPLAYEWAAPLLPSNTTVEKGESASSLVHPESGLITVPAGTTCIGVQAFAGNTDVTEVVLAASVHSIAAEAFHDCTNLEKVTFMGRVFINSRGTYIYIYVCVSISMCVFLSLCLSCTLTLTPHSLTHSLPLYL